MNWLFFALLAGLFFALSRVVARIFLKKQGDALAFTAVHDFIAGAVLLPLIIFDFHLPKIGVAWLLFLGVTIFALLSDWYAFRALKLIDVSIYKIAMQVRHIFTLFGGWLFFSEPILFIKILAIILIISGVTIAMYERKKMYWSKGINLTILSTFFAFVAFMFAKSAINYFNEITLASLELMLIGVIIYAVTKFNTKKIIKEIKINKWGLLVAGGLFGLCEMFLFLALKTGEISRVVMAVQISLVFGVLIGIIFLKEKERMWQKFAGVGLIVGSIIMLYYF